MLFWEQIQRSHEQWLSQLEQLSRPEEVINLQRLRVKCMRMREGNNFLFVGKQIATGYFGIVYTACIVTLNSNGPAVIEKDLVLKRTTASWTMFQNLPAEVLYEAEQMKELYPRDKQYILAFLFEGRPALLMPNLGHKTLEDRLHESPPLTLQQKLSIVLQICEQLSTIHGVRRIHADLQAANIVLEQERASLVDFGHSRPEGQIGKMGAAGYQSLDALGAALFKGLATTKIDISALGQLLREVFDPEIKTRGELRALIQRCKAFLPSKRPDLKEIVDELKSIFRGIHPTGRLG